MIKKFEPWQKFIDACKKKKFREMNLHLTKLRFLSDIPAGTVSSVKFPVKTASPGFCDPGGSTIILPKFDVEDGLFFFK